jgi:8-amino-7-oxononanoate synthase
MESWNRALDKALRAREEKHQLRSRRAVRPIDATHVECDGRQYINFASNDYLGLSHHPKVIDTVREAAAKWGVGSGAAGLISGYSDPHASAERAIAAWKGTESAILLPSGYQANHAAIQTLATIGGRGVRFLLDKNVHASLIDAVRGMDTEPRIFPHNNLDKLQRLLADAPSDRLQVVVTESIFSMDGDAADLAGIAALKQQYPFFLLLDEAHGSGVYGNNGSGYASELDISHTVDASIVTLSKAIGCIGGAVCASQRFIDGLTNFGRAWIFSTHVPPMIAAAAEASLQVMHDETWRQERVRKLARQVRQSLGAALVPGLPNCPIIPIVLGDEERALQASKTLAQNGLWTIAVRPPTVPPSSSRLRVTLSCEHTDQEVDLLIQQLLKIELPPASADKQKRRDSDDKN